MCWKTITIILCVSVASTKNYENVGMFEKIKSGFKYAGNLFSSEHASKVANLVSSALGHTQVKDHWTKTKPVNYNKSNIISGFLRLFGLDSKKIGAIAVNAIIIVAQLIGTSISLTPPSQLEEFRTTKADSPFDWMLNNSAVADLLKDAKDERLSDQVLEYITERSVDEESACIQLLMCKSTPFIKGMQNMFKNKKESKAEGSFALFQYFPSTEEVANNADDCLKKHNFCSLRQ